MSRSTSADADPKNQAAPEDSGAVLLRPHHVMCAIGWAGHGYSPAFTENMNSVVEGRLRADPDTTVQFTATADSICTPCPHRRGAGCEMGGKIAALDLRHADALGLAPGARMSWGEARSRAVSRLRPDDLDRICAGCQWLEYGLCKAALAQLQK